MKKQKMLLVLCICLIMTSLCACGKNKKDEVDEPIGTLSPFASEEEKDAYYKKLASKIKVKKANGKYKYDQEDQVINDKYRNFYQIMVATFCDSDGNGMGDLNGVTSKLDYIEDMGYNGIWLTPIMESGQYHGYDITDFKKVDSDFGTLEDFKKLADECKKRNITLILDLVLNHTSSSHPWFMEAKTHAGDKNNKYSGYYNFVKEDLGDTFYPIGNGYYFEGEFWDQMPDLNLQNKDLRKEVEGIIDFWMDNGAGGFRLDAVIHFEEDDTEENVKILKWINEYTKKKNPDAYIVGEAWVDAGTVSRYYESGVDSFFNFDIGCNTGLVASLAKAGMESTLATTYVDELIKAQTLVKEYNKEAIDAPFLSNHDMTRSSAFIGDDVNKMKLASGLLQMVTGATFTYYGEEIGMAGNGDQDVNFRLGMYWSKTDNGEQPDSPPAASLTNSDHKLGSVEEQIKDKNSLLNYNKRILQLKAENPEIARGEVSKIDGIEDKQIVAMKKTYNGESVIIVVNPTNYPKQIKVAKSNGYSKIRGYATVDDTEVTLKGETLTMSGNSIVILK